MRWPTKVLDPLNEAAMVVVVAEVMAILLVMAMDGKFSPLPT